uniref:Kinesin motor domain-containing protein n=1 Tax=Haemonchus contortus TaxID=6289 RepID=A0A7I4YK00_HAECO
MQVHRGIQKFELRQRTNIRDAVAYAKKSKTSTTQPTSARPIDGVAGYVLTTLDADGSRASVVKNLLEMIMSMHADGSRCMLVYVGVCMCVVCYVCLTRNR